MKNINIKKLLLTVLAAGLWVACTESGLPVAGAEEGIMFKIADQEVEAACGPVSYTHLTLPTKA